MSPWQRLSTAIRRSVRYKLLALSLFPILLALPAALGLAIYWGGRFGYDQLHIKVGTDLSVAHDAFNRAQGDYLKVLSHLAESFGFRTDLARDDTRAVELLVERVRQQHGFAFLHLVDRQGKWITVNWYISAYEPIKDVSGRRIGMLYTGFLDEPFRSELRGALLILLLLFAGLALISAAVAVGLSKSIFKPLEVMSGVMHATRKGKNRRACFG